MKETQQFSNGFDQYLDFLLAKLRTKYTNVSVNRHEYICQFFFYGHPDCKTVKVKVKTIETAMKTKRLPLSIGRLLR